MGTRGRALHVRETCDASQDWGGPICLFLARTEDFSATLARHDMRGKRPKNLEAREIHLLVVRDGERRAEIERDILEAQTDPERQLRRVA